MTDLQDRLRQIPQVSTLLEDSRLVPLMKGRRLPWMTRLVQDAVAALRVSLRAAKGQVASREKLHEQLVGEILDQQRQLVGASWTRVINGTGVVVHTNLGRSCYPAGAADAARTVALHNSDLEYDLAAGVRGHRGRLVEKKLALLAGAEDALIVNNNAAAVWLAVRYASQGGKVLLSRGEVVSIGGSFRMNNILTETGCQLVEVGTTNRTSLDDFAEHLEPGCTVIKVHRSNFVIEGFTEDVEMADLADLCHSHGALLIYDAGSGALFPYEELGLPAGERLLNEDVATGADLITCSGDKLLGGCQAGMILGSKQHIAGLRKHPMRRALRVDKTTLAALDSVMSLYLAADDQPDIPTLNYLGMSLETLQIKAEDLQNRLQDQAPAGWTSSVVSGQSSVGGGSFSTTSIESRLLQWTGPKEELEACHQSLRTGDPALVGRMNQDGLAVDVRTISEEEITLVVDAFQAAWTRLKSSLGESI